MQLAERLTKSFTVCNSCLSRQTGRVISTEIVRRESYNCYICKGLWKKVESITNAARSTSKKHDFSSFLIGLTLPAQMCEREDQLRSLYKIKGRETLKAALTRTIRHRFVELSGRKLDLFHPDIIMLINIDDVNICDFKVSVRSKALTLRGIYKKNNRLISLRCMSSTQCPRNNPCSIEDILRCELLSRTGADSVSFSWFGMEDRESLVLGKGRPFFATMKNPIRRYLKHDIRFETKDIHVKIDKDPTYIPRRLPSFINKIRVVISCGDKEKIVPSDLQMLNKSEIICVRFLNKKAYAVKLIYSMSAKQLDGRRFVLTMVCDGGLPIRRFIDGYEQTIPNVAALVDKNCKCDLFDILDLSVQEDFMSKSANEFN